MGLIMLYLNKFQAERNLPSKETTGKSVTFLANADEQTRVRYEMEVGNIKSCWVGFKVVACHMILNTVQFVKRYRAIKCWVNIDDNSI